MYIKNFCDFPSGFVIAFASVCHRGSRVFRKITQSIYRLRNILCVFSGVFVWFVWFSVVLAEFPELQGCFPFIVLFKDRRFFVLELDVGVVVDRSWRGAGDLI